jgi:aspartate kinase
MLDELEQLLKGNSMVKELTPRTNDYLVSFRECMSTRILSVNLNNIHVKARQVLLDISLICTMIE